MTDFNFCLTIENDKIYFQTEIFSVIIYGIYFENNRAIESYKIIERREIVMKKVIVIVLLSFLVGGCKGQKKQTDKATKQIASVDTIANPKVDVRVNKRYDDKGNLLQYDSTYSYFYSSPGFKNSISSDSLFSNFKIPLRNDYKGLLDDNMNSIFFNDSLFKYDFYNKDYFSKRFQLNMLRFENMFKQMDSIKSDMFRQSYPDGAIKKK